MKRSIVEVIDQEKHWILRIPNVNGIALGQSKRGKGEQCINVYVASQRSPDGLPVEIDGYAIEVIPNSGFSTFK